ncbi:MAG: cobalamin adenosyltransferase [Gammaproteobacteria bacterium SG8_15]|nr:MAG: cobalamin adenosyltransferase [Gammaproteobacteria bacterium SG8_15]
MGNRLSKIYTRTGDKGTTGLSDGSRVSKSNARIAAIGDVDELNSVIGIILTQELEDNIRNILTTIQHCLFNLGGELSLPGYELVKPSHITYLETQLDNLNNELAPLKDFILPGGTLTAAFTHQARSVCRRAERNLVVLQEEETVSTSILQYLNRLSDFLFVLARHINKQSGQPDVLWKADKGGTD